jgi:hypothetical protein
MSRVPKRVKIGSEWYDVNSGIGRLELIKYGSPISYSIQEPFAHITNLYYVYNSSGSQVGEFHIDNRTYSGCVSDFEA